MKKENRKLLIKKYFESKNFTKHNIDSFDEFIENGMQKVVNEFGEIAPDILPIGVRDLRIKLGKIWIDDPQIKEADGSTNKILPMEARLRDLTYESPIMLEMTSIQGGEEREKQNIQIGSLPIMLRSKKCYLNNMKEDELIKAGEDPYDPGAYFIINGTERAIVIVEDLISNKILIDEKNIGTYPYVGRIFSQDGKYNIPHSFEKSKDGTVYISFTKIQKIPFVLLMKALGITKDKDILEAVSTNSDFSSDLYINLYETKNYKNEEEALGFIGKKMGITIKEKRVERAEGLIDRFLLPHLGHSKEDRIQKAKFIGRAVKKLLLVSYGKIDEDDKDHYSNKRLRLCGDSLETLFRHSFRMLMGDAKYNFERLVKRGKMPNLKSVIRSQLLTQRLRSSMATGEWPGNRHGISQHLDRLNYFATISHVRRIVSLLAASRENFEARDLHPTHWGRLCASETPEGVPIGLRKNLALTCEISTSPEMEEKDIITKLKDKGLEN